MWRIVPHLCHRFGTYCDVARDRVALPCMAISLGNFAGSTSSVLKVDAELGDHVDEDGNEDGDEHDVVGMMQLAATICFVVIVMRITRCIHLFALSLNHHHHDIVV